MLLKLMLTPAKGKIKKAIKENLGFNNPEAVVIIDEGGKVELIVLHEGEEHQLKMENFDGVRSMFKKLIEKDIRKTSKLKNVELEKSTIYFGLQDNDGISGQFVYNGGLTYNTNISL